MGRQLVLVVDDDRGVQDAVREELANRDYEVVIAGDGDAAMRLLDAMSPDVLVLDLKLPRVSGPMVAAKLNMLSSRPRCSSARRYPTRPRSPPT
jgi:two-component system response regulator VicR